MLLAEISWQRARLEACKMPECQMVALHHSRQCYASLAMCAHMVVKSCLGPAVQTSNSHHKKSPQIVKKEASPSKLLKCFSMQSCELCA